MTMTQWWAPTIVRVSGDESVRGQLLQTLDGNLLCKFPERLVMIANHQVLLYGSSGNTRTNSLDLHRLVVSVVDRVYRWDARSYLHRSERVFETNPDHWVGNAVLSIYISQAELGER